MKKNEITSPLEVTSQCLLLFYISFTSRYFAGDVLLRFFLFPALYSFTSQCVCGFLHGRKEKHTAVAQKPLYSFGNRHDISIKDDSLEGTRKIK
jgi:hypothetical protein